MKLKVVSIIICICICLSFVVGLVMAEDDTALKERVDALETEVLKLKQKPAESPGGVKLGGHLKLYMYDQSVGTSNDEKQTTTISAGLTTLYLFITDQLSDLVSLEVQPRISVSASATPSLGNNFARAKTSTVNTSVYQAFMTVRLPQQAELRVGKMLTYFSDDYGRQIWYDEYYHINPGFCSLLSWDDYGVELYKSFDFAQWSLPTYFYLLNGEATDVDNNNAKSFLLHVDPEFFQGKLRLLGSYGFGKWDDASRYTMVRTDVGFDWKWQKINIKSEYLTGKWNNKITQGADLKDGKKSGYYIKGLYRFNQQWRGLINYSRAVTYATYPNYDDYKTTTLGVNYFITESSSIMGQFSMVDAKRTDDSEGLTFNRYTVGWRTTF